MQGSGSRHGAAAAARRTHLSHADEPLLPGCLVLAAQQVHVPGQGGRAGGGWQGRVAGVAGWGSVADVLWNAQQLAVVQCIGCPQPPWPRRCPGCNHAAAREQSPPTHCCSGVLVSSCASSSRRRRASSRCGKQVAAQSELVEFSTNSRCKHGTTSSCCKWIECPLTPHPLLGVAIALHNGLQLARLLAQRPHLRKRTKQAA